MSRSLVGSEPSGKCNRLNGDTRWSWCEFDTGDLANSWAFSKEQAGHSGVGFNQQGVMWQEAHTCDRDYMHMRDMRSCHGSPSFTWWKGLAEGSAVVNPNFMDMDGTYLKQGSLIRTYRLRPSMGGRVTASIGVMRHVDNPFFGFLGGGRVPGLQYRDYTDFRFTKCNTIRQCFMQDFTMYGYTIPQRRIRRQPGDPIGGELMPRMDTFNCGAFGYMKSGTTTTCALDMGVTPLYRAMCYSQQWRQSILGSCPTIIGMTEANLVTQYCAPFGSAFGTCNGRQYAFTRSPFSYNGFVPEWAAGNEDLREGIPCLLNSLANLFNPVRPYTSSSSTVPSTLAYLEAMECAQTIQNAIVSTPDGVPQYTFPTDPDNEDSPMRTEIGGKPGFAPDLLLFVAP